MSDISKYKMSLAKIGKPSNHLGKMGGKRTLESRIKLSVERFGSGNPNWKGGITKTNASMRNKLGGRKFRLNILSRDNYQCHMPNCDSNCKELEVHHISKFSGYPELRSDNNNAITLCCDCHEYIRNREDDFKMLFYKILEKMSYNTV